jgi:hypothetical protein
MAGLDLRCPPQGVGTAVLARPCVCRVIALVPARSGFDAGLSLAGCPPLASALSTDRQVGGACHCSSPDLTCVCREVFVVGRTCSGRRDEASSRRLRHAVVSSRVSRLYQLFMLTWGSRLCIVHLRLVAIYDSLLPLHSSLSLQILSYGR